MRAGVGDIALGPVPGRTGRGPLERLGFEELVVVLPASDPLAGGRRAPLAALADRSWILFQPGHGLTEVVDAACRRRRLPAARGRADDAGGGGDAASPRRASGLRWCRTTCLPRPRANRRAPRPAGLRELAAYTRSEWSPLASAFLEALQAGDWLRRSSSRTAGHVVT